MTLFPSSNVYEEKQHSQQYLFDLNESQRFCYLIHLVRLNESTTIFTPIFLSLENFYTSCRTLVLGACRGYLARRSVDTDIVCEQITFLITDRLSDSLSGGQTEGRRVLIFAWLSIDPCGWVLRLCRLGGLPGGSVEISRIHCFCLKGPFQSHHHQPE